MSSVVVVGAQWGDEGKGKVVDLLTRDADIVVRFQGGNNAGHTVLTDGQKYSLHLIPSGILHPGKRCFIANGVVLDPAAFCKEIDELRARGVVITPDNLSVSLSTHLIMPYHSALDQARESDRGDSKIGTTGRGIGPCYEDKAARIGIRAADLADQPLLLKKIQHNLAEKNALLSLYKQPGFTVQQVMDEIRKSGTELLPFLADIPEQIAICRKQGGNILFEGAQGSLLDIDHGTYPFVTSSNTVSGGASAGSGVAPWSLSRIIGIVKAYTTRVGSGPFPTELTDALGLYLREQGVEFGVTTGRPRRCGWFDAVILRSSVRLSGITEIALTKLDVLSSLDELKICTAYKYKGQTIFYPPQEENGLDKVEPVYETLSGWKENLAGARREEDLPAAARGYVRRMEELLDVPVKIISVGPDREQTIFR
ncbi:MAG: adenylosuccinate synthase [Deltaproteobacteria bacterium]|jgi:adenylosuccinate synthase|nr:adenylosuccinate synthase [Deltaproteobacteria bacterium]